MADIFLSYSRSDREFAAALRTSLGELKRDVWMDVDDIPPTAKWRPEISAGIESAQAIVVVLSPYWVRSQECATEVVHALKHGKRIVPVLCREVDASTVSPQVQELNWISFLPPEDRDAALQKLIKALDADLDWLRAHTRLLVRAVEWEASGHEPSFLLRGKDLNDAEHRLGVDSTAKDPAPTSLQREYVTTGRRAAVTRKRALVSSVLGSLVVVAALAWGFYNARQSAAFEQTARVAADGRAEEQQKAATLESRLKNEAQRRADEQTKVAELQRQLAVTARQGEQQAQETARDQRVLGQVADSYQRLYREPLQAVDSALNALRTKATDEGRLALSTARDVAVKRRENRRNEAQLTGTGPGFLMERWREGKMFSKLSRDGRHALVATERGTDGATPPGQVFLLNLDGLTSKELLPGTQASRRRLEFLGFSSSGQEIFVSRQFYLDIYDLNGERTTSTQLEFHAKPIHLVAGMFGQHVLVGDTVGHVMLADTASGDRPQLRGGSAQDAPLFVESNADGNLAILVFESGRADLLTLSDPRNTGQRPLPVERIVFAGFDQTRAVDRFVTATGDGHVDVWEVKAGTLRKLHSFVHGRGPVGVAGFSADGARVVSLGDDGSIRVWDLASGTTVFSDAR